MMVSNDPDGLGYAGTAERLPDGRGYIPEDRHIAMRRSVTGDAARRFDQILRELGSETDPSVHVKAAMAIAKAGLDALRR